MSRFSSSSLWMNPSCTILRFSVRVVTFVTLSAKFRLGTIENEEKIPVFTRIFEQDYTLTEDEILKELAHLNPVILPLQRTLFTFTTSYSVRCELESYPLIQDKMILKAYMDSDKDYKDIASRYQIIEDVTDNMNYSTLEIAKSGCKVFNT